MPYLRPLIPTVPGDTLDALITKLNSLPPELATLKDILKSVTKLP
jgi:hypothetical protein